MKQCSLCKEEFSTEDAHKFFHRNRNRPDGLRVQCKKCRSKGGARDGFMPDGNDYSAFVGEGFGIKGKSTQYKIVDGKPVETGGWVKTDRDKEAEEAALREYIDGLFEGHTPAKPVPTPIPLEKSKYLQLFAWGDPHIGLYAWELETGNRFDLEVVETLMVNSIKQSVEQSDYAEEALLVSVGDTFHADNFKNTTPKNSNALDVAGRYHQILRLGAAIFRECIDAMLNKFQTVHVKIVPGNHDPKATYALQLGLSLLYENEPRVKVDEAAGEFQWHRFGKTLLGFNHGHRVKPTELALTMAVDKAADWGECDHHYIYTGHVHHQTVKEIHKVKIETLNTLAGADGYHRGGGYRSVRSMRIDTFHEKYGRVNQATRGIQQILGELEEK